MRYTYGWTVITLLPLLLISGCAKVSGSDSDAASGAPLSDAEVGLVVLRPFSFFPSFSEQARTNNAGAYSFTHFERNPRVYVLKPGYLLQTKALARSPRSTQNFQLQSIANIVGNWDVTLDSSGVVLSTTQFNFTERGIQWFSTLGFLGDIYFDFDGSKVAIDDALTIGGDVVAGEMKADLQLDESGDVMVGSITFNHSFFGGTACSSGCGGTLTAVRSGG